MKLNEDDIKATIADVQSWLSKGRLAPSERHIGSYRMSRAKCGFFDYDDERALEVMDLAWAGDPDAICVIRHCALDFIYSGQPLPPNLKEYVVRVLEGPFPPSRKRTHKFRDRDYYIATGVLIAAKRGFPLSRKSKLPSAWEVVAKALGRLRLALGDRTVEEIWNAHEHVRSQLSKQTGPK